MPPGRPRAFRTEAALDAAAEVFRDRGYEETSISDLERCLGLGRQSLYNAIGDKRCLFLAALRRYGDQALAARLEALTTDEPPFVRIRRWADGWIQAVSEPCGPGCLTLNTIGSPLVEDPEIHAILKDQLVRTEEAVTAAAASALGEPATSPLARSIAQGLLGLFHGAALLRRVHPLDPTALRTTVDVLLRPCERRAEPSESQDPPEN